MTNPYNDRQRQDAYERGAADERAKLATEDGEKPKLLTREQIRAMSTEDINRNWLRVQDSLRAGLPSGDDDE